MSFYQTIYSICIEKYLSSYFLHDIEILQLGQKKDGKENLCFPHLYAMHVLLK